MGGSPHPRSDHFPNRQTHLSGARSIAKLETLKGGSMSDSESSPTGDDWWSSGTGSSRGVDRLGRIGGQGPSYASEAPSYPSPQHPPPGYAYQPYPPQPHGGYGGGYPGTPGALPPYGPGSLAELGSRFGARLLDAIFMIPWSIIAFVLSLAIVRPWEVVGATQFGGSNSSFSTTRFVEWMILTVVLLLVGWTLYEGLFTHLMGRTPGKAIVHIRPQWDRQLGPNLTIGRAMGRSVAYWFWGLIPYIGGILGFIGVLSCVWNPRRQCWHDRICSTIVVNDR